MPDCPPESSGGSRRPAPRPEAGSTGDHHRQPGAASRRWVYGPAASRDWDAANRCPRGRDRRWLQSALGQRHDIGVIGSSIRGPVGCRDFDVRVARADELHEVRRNPAVARRGRPGRRRNDRTRTVTGDVATASLIAAIIGRLVLIWMCHLRPFIRSMAFSSRSRPTAGSLMPAVARFSRMPRTPARSIASRSRSGVRSSMTATPRASLPRAFMPYNVAELSVPYTLGVTMTTRWMRRAL